MKEKIPVLQLRNFIRVANSLLHTPYRWGGDDPTGIDCSGLVIECLKAVGLFNLDGDTTADGLWKMFKKGNIVEEAQAGDLIFWLDSNGDAYHVAIAVDWYHCITADGGGKRVKTLEDAIKYNAFVKIRTINHRKNLPKIINIFNI